jgi:ubiquinone/menaquinone biosynthesis C-methylase UbiE
MLNVAHRFDDSAAYERFMGLWSRAAGAVFLGWMAAPADAQWLDVGCGTGILTHLIFDTCCPAAVISIDPAEAQIDYACRGLTMRPTRFSVADAQALPFPDCSFDVIASALVINFIPDQIRALSEMRRVARADAIIAAYVWDFAAGRSPSWPLRSGLHHIGTVAPEVPGTKKSGLGALHSLFESAGLERIATRSIDVTVRFSDFDEFWQAQLPSYSPMTKMIAAMTASDRKKLKQAILAALPAGQNGGIEYSARANAIKARVPR